tara:strand:+ start:1653 stop:2591 length:939 start_codon:yes stop_codon:yes gene_type:complete
MFNTKTVKELKELCKKNNIKQYSSLKKDELIKILNQHVGIIPDKIIINTENIENKQENIIICSKCNEKGHKNGNEICRLYNIEEKIRKLVFENNGSQNERDLIDNLSEKYKVKKVFIKNIIKNIPKIDIIKNVSINLEEIVTDNISLCEQCGIHKYYNTTNRIWKNKNVCDFCWCKYEDERQELWNKINKNIRKNKCDICNLERTHTKIRFHFDHINIFDKDNSICIMVNNGECIDDIMREVEKCQFLCITCHNLITNIEKKYGFISYKTQLIKNLNAKNITEEEFIERKREINELYKNKIYTIYDEIKKIY